MYFCYNFEWQQSFFSISIKSFFVLVKVFATLKNKEIIEQTEASKQSYNTTTYRMQAQTLCPLDRLHNYIFAIIFFFGSFKLFWHFLFCSSVSYTILQDKSLLGHFDFGREKSDLFQHWKRKKIIHLQIAGELCLTKKVFFGFDIVFRFVNQALSCAFLMKCFFLNENVCSKKVLACQSLRL